jgi:hypothetical protein
MVTHAVTAVVPGPSRRRPSARVALTTALLTLSLPAAAWAGAQLVAGGHYSGTTSQKQAATIVVSSNGKSIAKLQTAVAYDHECASATGPTYAISLTNVPIVKGSFSADAQGRASHKRSLKMIVTGSFVGRKVAGTVAELGGHCAKPRQIDNPYLATFSAKTG